MCVPRCKHLSREEYFPCSVRIRIRDLPLVPCQRNTDLYLYARQLAASCPVRTVINWLDAASGRHTSGDAGSLPAFSASLPAGY